MNKSFVILLIFAWVSISKCFSQSLEFDNQLLVSGGPNYAIGREISESYSIGSGVKAQLPFSLKKFSFGPELGFDYFLNKPDPNLYDHLLLINIGIFCSYKAHNIVTPFISTDYAFGWNTLKIKEGASKPIYSFSGAALTIGTQFYLSEKIGISSAIKFQPVTATVNENVIRGVNLDLGTLSYYEVVKFPKPKFDFHVLEIRVIYKLTL